MVEDVFGIKMRQKMQSLQGSKPVLERDARSFQVPALSLLEHATSVAGDGKCLCLLTSDKDMIRGC